MKKSTFAASVAAGTTALLLLSAPLAASAHVRVEPGQAAAGSITEAPVRVTWTADSANPVVAVFAVTRRRGSVDA